MALVLVTCLVGSPAVAQSSGPAVSVIIEIPTEVTVGQTNVAGRLVITNQTAGDTPIRINQIGYVAACRTLTLPCDAPDAGVFVLAASAMGTGGACAGVAYVVSNLSSGHATFVPQGVAVTLQPPGSPNASCTIEFTFDVHRMPTTTAQPSPDTILTRAAATVAVQRGNEGSTNMGTANITVRKLSVTAGVSAYHPLVPARILDTRDGTSGAAGAVGPGATARVQVTGRGGVPATGVTAVAMNVAVTGPSGEGYLAVFPAAGWFTYAIDGAGGRFQSLTPARILDTRAGGVRLGAGAALEVQVAGAGGVPPAGAEAVVMNVAVTNTSAPSYLTVHPVGEPRPLASNLNWVAGDTVSNRVIAKLGSSGRVTIYNNAGEADVVVDVNGWFTDPSQAGGSTYVPLNPARILDTRDGTGGVAGPVAAGATVEIQVTGRGGVPASGVSAVILNATVVSPPGLGYLTITPAGTARPLTSDLNHAAGETRPNLVVVRVGTGGRIAMFTSTGADVVFDVAGYFT